mmetsp:Transcript_18337/g.40091  ORF Transcript_18337/g.40091 Transcript_18337/m.40091 type:complete len:232 (+) Transcript_18337:124-819(+)
MRPSPNTLYPTFISFYTKAISKRYIQQKQIIGCTRKRSCLTVQSPCLMLRTEAQLYVQHLYSDRAGPAPNNHLNASSSPRHRGQGLPLAAPPPISRSCHLPAVPGHAIYNCVLSRQRSRAERREPYSPPAPAFPRPPLAAPTPRSPAEGLGTTNHRYRGERLHPDLGEHHGGEGGVGLGERLLHGRGGQAAGAHAAAEELRRHRVGGASGAVLLVPRERQLHGQAHAALPL